MKLLVVTTCFSPENAVGSIRLTKFVKYFVRNGIEVTVISPMLHEGSKIDTSLECEELMKVSRITIPQSKLFEHIFLKKRNNMLQKKSATQYIQGLGNLSFKGRVKVRLFRFVQFIYTLLRNWDWSRQVFLYVKENYKLGQFDTILTSYPSLGAPWSSIKIKKAGIANFLVTDFRDPVAYENNTTFIIHKIYKLIQRRITLRSDAVTFISYGVGDMLGVKQNNSAFLVTNGFDPDDKSVATSKGNDFLTLCYVGSLYGGTRDFSPLFEALRDLNIAGRVKKDQIRLVYAGAEASVLIRQAMQYGFESIIEDHGFVSREESLTIQSQSDICLVSSWNSDKDKGIMTGKLFEYFTNNKLVVAIVNGTVPGSEIAEVIRKVNAGVSLEVSSLNFKKEKTDLMDTLAGAFESKVKFGCLHHSYNILINEYTFNELSKKFVSILQGKSQGFEEISK